MESVTNIQKEVEFFDPIHDIIDYLVRCVQISFKNSRINEGEVRTAEKINMAFQLYQKSPLDFLLQFGKYLAPQHLKYFEELHLPGDSTRFQEYILELKVYHSEESKHKRVRNRRYKALQKMQSESDYFSEKQMMYRNPLLYEQLIGQYLSDDEIRERDGIDTENITFLNMILETVDRNQMRETKNVQMLEEDNEEQSESAHNCDNSAEIFKSKKSWGDFDTPDIKPNYLPEPRKQALISAPERNLLRQEFIQEMYNSFLEGNDVDFDYSNIDNDEQYDDLQQEAQDAEDRYFDSETNEVENLEEHMKLIEEYGRQDSKNSNETNSEDPLDVFMSHISNKLRGNSYIMFC
ncbi:coiled-coil domain-containing protein 97 [Plodia interpunctella]|uniref:coiled-coil domain-containing protein 97 n=1 Tax=Plodia interpunctella TaxID=58824 RepID=UPI002368E325|nr:coiled-coil domain-containing protein 97 [Plodia interpunctella]